MTSWFWWLAVFLVLNLAVGLTRVIRGTSRADRMIAAQLLGTTGVGILVVLWQALGVSALLDVALVFAILAAVTTVAFVTCAWGHPDTRMEDR